jgi:hypothetical protein
MVMLGVNLNRLHTTIRSAMKGEYVKGSEQYIENIATMILITTSSFV